MRHLLPQGFGLGGHISTTISGPPELAACAPVSVGLAPGSPEDLMLRALMVSMSGAGHTIPNPAVGCLVVQGSEIVAAGATEALGGRHAERVSFDKLRNEGRSLAGLDAYVTLEPCAHHGRQPPCCELFENSGLSKLFIAVGDPHPLVNGRGLNFVKKQGVRVITDLGVARTAATAWHLPFLLQHTLNRPLIAGKWAQTLDGALADLHGTSQWITGAEARAHGHWLRLKYDVVAVGLDTLLTDSPSLTVRDCWQPNNRQPHVCIVDPLGLSCASSGIFIGAIEKIIAAADNRKVALVCPSSHIGSLRDSIPQEVTLLGFEPPRKPNLFGAILSDLWKSEQTKHWLGRSPQSVFVEGGATLLSLLIEADALDVLHVFTAPMLLGGEARRVGVGTHASPNLSMAAHFDILSTAVLGNDMLLELAPRRIVNTFFARG